MKLTHVTAVTLSLTAVAALSGQQPQKPTFVSRIDLVTLDVVVRDKQGQFVPDLKRDDFIVLEDGVEQPDPLRRVRKIEVKVKRDDLTVFHRPDRALRYR